MLQSKQMLIAGFNKHLEKIFSDLLIIGCNVLAADVHAPDIKVGILDIFLRSDDKNALSSAIKFYARDKLRN